MTDKQIVLAKFPAAQLEWVDDDACGRGWIILNGTSVIGANHIGSLDAWTDAAKNISGKIIV